MKKFVFKIIFVLAPVMVLGVLGEFFVRNIPNDYLAKDKYIKQHDDLETVIIGSSHVMSGIRPEFIKGKVYNLAFPFETLEYDLFVIKKYLPFLPKLKNIILNVDYFNLFSQDLERYDWNRVIYYQVYLDCNKYCFLSKYNYEISNNTSFIAKIRRELTGTGSLYADSLGWNVHKLSSREDNWKDPTSNIETSRCKDWKNYEVNCSYLEKIANLCKEEGITLIMLSTPMYKTYYERLDNKQLRLLHEEIGKLIETYDNIYYLDYTTDSSFNDDDFYDVEHLTEFGAERLSKKINEDIKNVNE